MVRLQLTLLGGFQAQLDSGLPLPVRIQKAQALLAYLALPLGQAHPRDKLAALFWGDFRPTQARANLRQVLSGLRQALAPMAPSPLDSDSESLVLQTGAVDVDVASFEHGVADGTPDRARRGRSPSIAAISWPGLDVEEPPFEEWLLVERERLREAGSRGAGAGSWPTSATAGADEAAVQTALRLLALDPLQETVPSDPDAALLRGWAGGAPRCGSTSSASTSLRRELHAEPEAETSRCTRRSCVSGLRPRDRTPARGAAQEGARRHRARSRQPPRPRSSGRAGELGQLSTALDAAHARARAARSRSSVRRGSARARLVTELVARAAGLACAVLLGRAHEPDRILPFGPWVDALRSARVTEDMALLASSGPAWRAELGRLLPEVRGDEPPLAVLPSRSRSSRRWPGSSDASRPGTAPSSSWRISTGRTT